MNNKEVIDAVENGLFNTDVIVRTYNGLYEVKRMEYGHHKIVSDYNQEKPYFEGTLTVQEADRSGQKTFPLNVVSDVYTKVE